MLRLDRKKNQIEMLDPLLGESDHYFLLKGRFSNHLMVHVLGIIEHNAGKEFKQIEMVLLTGYPLPSGLGYTNIPFKNAILFLMNIHIMRRWA